MNKNSCAIVLHDNYFNAKLIVQRRLYKMAFVKMMDGLPKWAKLLLSLPGIAIVWSIYRLVLSIVRKSVLQVILAIILLFAGPAIWWLLDFIFIIIKDRLFWFSK